MTKHSELVEMLSRIISNGINMDKYNIFECNIVMKELYEYINLETPYSAFYSDKKITVESAIFNPLLSIELDKTTIQCIPITDDGWLDVVYEVIKYFHKKNVLESEKQKLKQKKIDEENKQFDWI